MNIWEQTLARIETKVNRHSFYTWFKPTTCILDGGDHLTIRVPNGLFRDWLLHTTAESWRTRSPKSAAPGRCCRSSREEPSAPFQESVSAPLPSIAPSSAGSPATAQVPVSDVKFVGRDHFQFRLRRAQFPRPRSTSPSRSAVRHFGVVPVTVETMTPSRQRPAGRGDGRGRNSESGGAQSPLHLRHLRRGLVEPVRARGPPRGRGGAGALLQPAVHLRRRGARQDPPDARHRALHACSTAAVCG